MKTISSSFTSFLKYWLLPLWTLFVIGLYFFLKDSVLFQFEAVQYFILWLTVDVIIFWNMFSIKEISIDDKQLYVTGFKSKEVIPFSDVEYVSGSRFAYPEQVWFRLKDKRIIVFLPKMCFSILQFNRHPMVEELADLCGLEDCW